MCGRLSIPYATQTSHADKIFLKQLLHHWCEVFYLILEIPLCCLNQLLCKLQRLGIRATVSSQMKEFGKDRMEDNDWYLHHTLGMVCHARATKYTQRTSAQTSTLNCL